MKQKTTIDYLDWDSKFFGYKIGMSYFDHSKESVVELIENSQKCGYKLVYIFYLAPKELDKALLKNNKIALVDQKITYQKNILTTEHVSKDTHITSFRNSSVTDNLLHLTLQSGVYSRYKLDKHFSNNEYEKLYTHWLQESLNGNLADDVFIYQEGDQQLGILTIKFLPEWSEIGLLAVDERHRGKSIGTSLMHHAIHATKEKNLTKIKVATQKQNSAACSFYAKHHFTVESVVNIYHLWND